MINKKGSDGMINTGVMSRANIPVWFIATQKQTVTGKLGLAGPGWMLLSPQ